MANSPLPDGIVWDDEPNTNIVSESPVPAEQQKVQVPVAQAEPDVTWDGNATTSSVQGSLPLPDGITWDKPTPVLARGNLSIYRDKQALFNLIDTEAERFGIPKELAHAVVQQESGYNPRAKSSAGAKGLMQLMDGTARDVGVYNPYDPEQNVRGGMTYLRRLIDKYDGNTQYALAAYNMGPGAFDNFLSGKQKMPKETIGYVGSITRRMQGGKFDPSFLQSMQIPKTRQFAEGLKQGINNTFLGAIQAVTELQKAVGLASQEDVEDITQEGQASKDSFQTLRDVSGPARIGEVVGETFPYAAIPGGAAEGAVGRILGAGTAGALQGATQFEPEGENRLKDATLGAIGGAVGSSVLSGLGKIGNAIFTPRTSLTKQLSDKWGIPLTKSEEATGASSRTDVLLERSPWIFGNKAFRREQRDATHSAAKRFLGEYIADPTSPNIMESNRAFADQIYEGMKSLIQQVPDQQISPKNLKLVATELLDRYPSIFESIQDMRVKRILQDIKSGVKDVQTPGVGSGFGVTNLSPNITTSQRTLTFDEAWELRKGLGELIGKARTAEAGGKPDRTAMGQFKALFKATSNDMDDWARSIGRNDISDAFRLANKSYQDYVVKYDILQRAYQKSVREVGEGELFSPAIFSNNLRSIANKNPHTKTFTETEIAEMSGLANILQVAKRAGQSMENPPTGNRWGPITAVGGLEGGAYATSGGAGVMKATAGLAGVTLLAKFLTTTKPGKALALSASRVNPVSPRMQEIANQIYTQLPKFAASEGIDLAEPRQGESINIE